MLCVCDFCNKAFNRKHRSKSVFKYCSVRCRSDHYKIRYSGEGNPFFGKTHSEEAKDKIRNKDYSAYKTQEFRNKISVISKKNNPNGVNYYNKWCDKYGKEIADELELKRRQKLSKASSGKNNPMYGKPTPQGSGNGWSGWYNGWYFRSLRELGFVVNYLEYNNINWKSATHKIKYKDYNDVDRTYVPDFLVENRLVEIKPTKLIDTPLVKLKISAANNYCKNHGLVYEIVDYQPVELDQLSNLIEDGKVILTERYKNKYNEWKNSHHDRNCKIGEKHNM